MKTATNDIGDYRNVERVNQKKNVFNILILERIFIRYKFKHFAFSIFLIFFFFFKK